jgi:hypothetical protein
MDNADYTQLPIGYSLEDGRRIAKCPKCGRNGASLYLREIEYFEHFAMKTFLTATGELRAKRLRKNSTCLVKKISAKQRHK